jgi:hypothetical protein
MNLAAERMATTSMIGSVLNERPCVTLHNGDDHGEREAIGDW